MSSTTSHNPAVNSSNGTPATSQPKPLIASDHAHDRKFHLLLAATGSVATIKLPTIINALTQTPLGQANRLSIRVLVSPSAAEFLQGQSDEQPPLFPGSKSSLAPLLHYPNVHGIHLDADEWSTPWTRGAPILHIELRRWADLLVVAPLSANSLAKLAAGMSEGLVHSVMRAWEVWPENEQGVPEGLNDEGEVVAKRQKRILLAPAMNTMMWKHPLTGRHLAQLGDWMYWATVLPPIQKALACGDTGDGAMCSVQTIVDAVKADMDDWASWSSDQIQST